MRQRSLSPSRPARVVDSLPEIALVHNKTLRNERIEMERVELFFGGSVSPRADKVKGVSSNFSSFCLTRYSGKSRKRAERIVTDRDGRVVKEEKERRSSSSRNGDL